MAHSNPQSHLPYAIRYMARLQEQAAQTAVSTTLPGERLEKCAAHLRETAHLIGRANSQGATAVTPTMPQKIKLLDFLRRQGLSQ